MIEQIFETVFLATLFALPLTLVLGLALLAWPRRTARDITVHHHAPVRA